MKGWLHAKLEDMCIIGDGNHSSKYPKKSEMISAGVPFIRSTNLVDGHISGKDILYISEEKHQELKKGHLKTGDVLFTNRGEIGKVAIVDEAFDGANLNSQIAWLRCRNALLPKYLFFFLQSDQMLRHFSLAKSGAALQQFTIRMIKDVVVSYPPPPEQKRIVGILDEAFEGIDRAIANAEKNLANSRELFESYLNAIFTQKGDGWVEKKLEDICSITSKLVDPRQPEFLDLPHVGAGNMISLNGELIEVKTAREEELKSGKFIFDETMVLYSKIRPYLMKACRPEFSGLCSADVYPLLPNDGQLNRDFLFHLLMSRNFTNYAIAGSDRAGMPKVNRDHLFRYSTWIPSFSEQINLAQKIDEIASETQRLETIYRKKIAALNELKQSILQKAFTGELTADTANQTTKAANEGIAA